MAPAACPAIYKNSKLLDVLPTQKHIVPWLLVLLLCHLSGSPFSSWFPGLIHTHHPRFSSEAVISTERPWICTHLDTCAPTAPYIEIAVVPVVRPVAWARFLGRSHRRAAQCLPSWRCPMKLCLPEWLPYLQTCQPSIWGKSHHTHVLLIFQTEFTEWIVFGGLLI